MAAPIEFCELFVREVFDQLEQLGVLAEEMFSNVVTAGNGVLLILPIRHFLEALNQQAGFIFFDEGIPTVTPDDFDDIPTRTAKCGLQFLDDFSVAPDGPIEALQVAVDDEDEVIEFFAGGQRDGTQRFWFVAFAIAQYRPRPVDRLALSGRDRRGS